MKETKIKVNGMMCQGCENRVKNSLMTMEGIEKVEADHTTGMVLVTSNDNVDIKMMEEKIYDIGFEVIKED